MVVVGGEAVPVDLTRSDQDTPSADCHVVRTGGTFSVDPGASRWALEQQRFDTCDGGLERPYVTTGSYSTSGDSLLLSHGDRHVGTAVQRGDSVILDSRRRATFSSPAVVASTPKGSFELRRVELPALPPLPPAARPDCVPSARGGYLRLAPATASNEAVVGRFNRGRFEVELTLREPCTDHTVSVNDSGTYGQVAGTLMFSGRRTWGAFPGRLRGDTIRLGIRGRPWLVFEE